MSAHTATTVHCLLLLSFIIRSLNAGLPALSVAIFCSCTSLSHYPGYPGAAVSFHLHECMGVYMSGFDSIVSYVTGLEWGLEAGL